jgi:Uma2 family endonuclease
MGMATAILPSFTIDEALLPANLSAPPLSDEEFEALCGDHPDLFFETNGEGDIIVMPPAYSFTGVRNSGIVRRLDEWAERDGRGFATDSSTGFVLPNGARRSPDAAWTLKSRVAQLDPASRRKFWRLCPDFVIELRSDNDRPRLVREKMLEWMANGAQLAWLIDPENKSVAIYRPDGTVETQAGLDSGVDAIGGEGLVEGFTLPLGFIWDPLRA